MCRLAAITSEKYFSPMENITALETMKEGHDGSGMGLILKNLGGEFKDLKEYPVLSGISSNAGIDTINDHMDRSGFKLKHTWSPKIRPVNGIERHDNYFARVYDYPDNYKERSFEEKEQLLLKTRVELRKTGEKEGSITVFSFYPDVLTLKEVGDPLQLGEFFRA